MSWIWIWWTQEAVKRTKNTSIWVEALAGKPKDTRTFINKINLKKKKKRCYKVSISKIGKNIVDNGVTKTMTIKVWFITLYKEY